MKILLAAFGSRGDVQPMVALGMRLRADGHEVVIGASAGFEDWVRGYGLGFHAVGLDLESWVRSHGELTRHPARFLKPAMEYLRRDVELSLEQTYSAARGADLLVSGVHAAAPSVAEALGLPCMTLLFCPQMIRSRHHPPPGIPWLPLPGLCNQALWTTFGLGLDGMFKDAVNRRRREWKLEPIAHVMDYLQGARTFVASDPQLGELPPDVSGRITQTGSLTLSDAGALDPALERFLDRGAPPVYIGFGSMPDSDPRGTTRMLIEALAACDRRGVILSGWAELGGGDLPPSVLVIRSVPHALLLPRVALAVTHGGAGTTAAAARAGVPQIVVPHVADQYYWGHQIHARGLGSRPIARFSLTTARLTRAIQHVLSRQDIRDRARTVRAELERTDGVDVLARGLYEAARTASEPPAASERPAAAERRAA